jgi:hypothetical protein
MTGPPWRTLTCARLIWSAPQDPPASATARQEREHLSREQPLASPSCVPCRSPASAVPRGLEVVDLPDPIPGDGQQLYDVSTAGLNFAVSTTDRTLH